MFWTQAFQVPDDVSSGPFRIPWDPTKPLTTPSGLTDLDRAVQALTMAAGQMQSLFGRLDVPWGEVARLRLGSVDLPANGCSGDPFGAFRVLDFDISTLASTKQVVANGGDSYVATVEFGETVRAQVLLTYGNASQPGSPHIGDQLALAAKGELRPAWRTRDEILAHLEARDVIVAGKAR
jgi:acyl-homoserine-lactone acylase